MLLLIILSTAVVGIVLVASATLRLEMGQDPTRLEWLALGLGASTLGSLLPEEPSLRVPMYPAIRLICAAFLSQLPVAFVQGVVN
jgi:hypothetical protein